MGINAPRCRQERDRTSTIGAPESMPVVMESSPLFSAPSVGQVT
jgi:hypothetical protein